MLTCVIMCLPHKMRKLGNYGQAESSERQEGKPAQGRYRVGRGLGPVRSLQQFPWFKKTSAHIAVCSVPHAALQSMLRPKGSH